MEPKCYLVNEIYATLHGEGVRFGIPHVFVRFAVCNLACSFCDTEYESGTLMTAADLIARCEAEAAKMVPHPTEAEIADTFKVQKALLHGRVLDQSPCRNVLFCGGEPLLQLDEDLLTEFKMAGWFTVVETNGTVEPPPLLDWITMSPKVAEHAIKVKRCNEVKYVRAKGQGIPHPVVEADHYLVSPMFTGEQVDRETLAWCIKLVQENPKWRLTVQAHKILFGNLR